MDGAASSKDRLSVKDKIDLLFKELDSARKAQKDEEKEIRPCGDRVLIQRNLLFPHPHSNNCWLSGLDARNTPGVAFHPICNLVLGSPRLLLRPYCAAGDDVSTQTPHTLPRLEVARSGQASASCVA
jgi:hypothetical protein